MRGIARYPSVPRTAIGARAKSALARGQHHEGAGQLAEAERTYRRCIALARREGDRRSLIEGYRRWAVVLHLSQRLVEAVAACEQSLVRAREAQIPVLIAEALNTLAAFKIEAGDLQDAYDLLIEAIDYARHGGGIEVRVQQNLGIIANIQGDYADAMRRYRNALRAARMAHDHLGMARAYHNLGMLSADRQRWTVADKYFRESEALACQLGNIHLQGLCTLNRCEVLIARGRRREARVGADRALTIFSQLGVADGLAAAHRFLGIVASQDGWRASAEEHLSRAVSISQAAHLPLEEGEALRELALVYEHAGRNQEALRCLSSAHQRFLQVRAGRDVSDARARAGRLEQTYFDVVRTWGESIESADNYTFGHCGRVSSYAVAVGVEMNLDDITITTLRVGAHLHDVGKMLVPTTVLNKPGRLDPDELAAMQLHPLHGIALLEGIDFPWDIRPIIRSHHEHADGSGYPDGLKGDDIPLTAQITAIVDVFDALTTTRSYRPAMPRSAALEEITRCRRWWSPPVFEAFHASVASPSFNRQHLVSRTPPDMGRLAALELTG